MRIVFSRDREFGQKSLPRLNRNHCYFQRVLYTPQSLLGLLKFCF